MLRGNKDLDKIIQQMYDDDPTITMREMASRLHCSYQNLYNHLKTRQWFVDPRTYLFMQPNDEEKQEIIEMSKNGVSAQEIADMYGLARSTIYRIRLQSGIAKNRMWNDFRMYNLLRLTTMGVSNSQIASLLKTATPAIDNQKTLLKLRYGTNSWTDIMDMWLKDNPYYIKIHNLLKTNHDQGKIQEA